MKFHHLLIFGGLSASIAATFAGCSAGTDDAAAAQPLTVDFGACEAADAGDPALERYGTSCVCCHTKTFSVAGSVDRDAGVETILVVDRDGKTAEMATNPHDNFFQHRRLTPPLAAVVIFADGERRTMKSLAPHGSCNGCHGVTTARVGAR